MSQSNAEKLDVSISPGDSPEKNLSPQQDIPKADFKPVRYERKEAEDGSTYLGFDFSEFTESLDVFLHSLARTAGLEDRAFALNLINQVCSAVSRKSDKGPDKRNAATASLLDIEPRDALEGMLSAQLVSVHAQAMESLRMANEAKFHDERTVYQNQAIKLMRLYTAQLEALKKYRRKGQTTLTIQRKG